VLKGFFYSLMSMWWFFMILLENHVLRLSERHYWTKGWVHLILSVEILSDHCTSENGGLVHFSSEAGSIFTFWAESYETYTMDLYDHVPWSFAIWQSESYGERSCKFDVVDPYMTLCGPCVRRKCAKSAYSLCVRRKRAESA
jgi:hypothetical protein